MYVCGISEIKELAERAQAQHRAEKQKRKEVELKLSNLDEELQDLKSEKESLERVSVSFKKRKASMYFPLKCFYTESACACARPCWTGRGSGRQRGSAVMRSWRR